MKKNFIKNKKNFFYLNKTSLLNFKKKIKNKNSGYKILLHGNSNKKLHQMLIFHNSNVVIKPHLNKYPKSYYLIEGVFELIFYKNKKIFKKFLVNRKSPYIYFENKIFHTLNIKSEKVFLIETTLGPHTKTIYSKW